MGLMVSEPKTPQNLVKAHILDPTCDGSGKHNGDYAKALTDSDS
jgi:hypothetical protein